jgi:hypothetical protein
MVLVGAQLKLSGSASTSRKVTPIFDNGFLLAGLADA